MAIDKAENYQKIIERVKVVASSHATNVPVVIAVSKTQPIEAIEELYRMGQRDFAENYAQELVEKAIQAKERGMNDLRWHFIGHLQKNKIKTLMPYLYAVHSVDSVELARKLDEAWARIAHKNPLSVFLQVNLDHEPTKSGFDESDVALAATAISEFGNLKLEGLMVIPNAAASEESFRRLRELEKSLRPSTRGALSMGMSADFESAIKEGSTHLRLGTVLFGRRR